jgi:hypothetical protein
MRATVSPHSAPNTSVATRPPRPEHRAVGLVEQRRRLHAGGPRRRTEREAKLRRVVRAPGCGDVCHEPVTGVHCRGGVRLRHHHDELVAAVAAHLVGRAGRAAQRRTHGTEHGVSGTVPAVVIDALEAVDVEEGDRERLAATLAAPQLGRDRAVQRSTREATRQLIVVRVALSVVQSGCMSQAQLR